MEVEIFKGYNLTGKSIRIEFVCLIDLPRGAKP